MKNLNEIQIRLTCKQQVILQQPVSDEQDCSNNQSVDQNVQKK